MKVLMINGSPHKEGNTYIALKEMEKMYRQMDIGLDIYTIALENYDCVEDEYY